jgi:transposase
VFIRRVKNRSGSKSIQVISKQDGKYRVVKSFGSSFDENDLRKREKEAEFFIAEQTEKNQNQIHLFSPDDPDDTVVREFVKKLKSADISSVGPELVLGKVFDSIGLNAIDEEIFRHITLARLVYPVSKLKTVEYLAQHRGVYMDISSVYRFLDAFDSDKKNDDKKSDKHNKRKTGKNYKSRIEKIVYEHSRKILGKIQMVFYDMTTLYFEAEEEDDLRKIGFSKDGKFQCPQIMLGLLVGENGYPIGYDIFEGNTFEGHTMIPVIKAIQKKYDLSKPIVIADSGLLSNDNTRDLAAQGYEFILGARIKNEKDQIKEKILGRTKGLEDKKSIRITKPDGNHLVVSYSAKRARKDDHNRTKGIERLRKKITGGKLTKTSINNRGYNKYLTLEDKEIKVTLNEEKIGEDVAWDGLKGYVTNAKGLSDEEVIQNYNHLWKIEKAFRISKTDLRIRPVFHRKRARIEAHLCIAFAAYAVYKELERQLVIHKMDISPAKAIELTKTIFQMNFRLPKSQKKISRILDPSPEQQKILNVFSDSEDL